MILNIKQNINSKLIDTKFICMHYYEEFFGRGIIHYLERIDYVETGIQYLRINYDIIFYPYKIGKNQFYYICA